MGNKKRILLFLNEVRPVSFKSLVSSWWSSFGVALSAVDWPASVWLEWNFAFLSAVSAGCLVHLFIIQLFFQLLCSIMRKNVFCTLCIFRRQRLNLSIQTPNFPCTLHEKTKACAVALVLFFMSPDSLLLLRFHSPVFLSLRL